MCNTVALVRREKGQCVGSALPCSIAKKCPVLFTVAHIVLLAVDTFIILEPCPEREGVHVLFSLQFVAQCSHGWEDGTLCPCRIMCLDVSYTETCASVSVGHGEGWPARIPD